MELPLGTRSWLMTFSLRVEKFKFKVGLDVCRATQLGPSAYLPSAMVCSALPQQIASPKIVSPPSLICHNFHVYSAHCVWSIWSSSHSQPP